MRAVLLSLLAGQALAQEVTYDLYCEEGGYAWGLDGVTFDFLNGTLSVNNLGGLGPGLCEDGTVLCDNEVGKNYLRYVEVGYDYVEEYGFDLKVENTTFYKLNKNKRNGYTFAGTFGQINLADDEECSFAYDFVVTGSGESAGEPKKTVVNREFDFCFFDFDSGDNDRLRETMLICQANMSYTTLFEQSGGLNSSQLIITQEGDCYNFTAKQRGYGTDNPEHPAQVLSPYEELTGFVKAEVAPKYVCVNFPAGLTGFELTYIISPSAEPGFSGRNFLYSGQTATTLPTYYVPCFYCPNAAYAETDAAGLPCTYNSNGYGVCISCGGATNINPCPIDRDDGVTVHIPDGAPYYGVTNHACNKTVARECDPNNPEVDVVDDTCYEKCSSQCSEDGCSCDFGSVCFAFGGINNITGTCDCSECTSAKCLTDPSCQEACGSPSLHFESTYQCEVANAVTQYVCHDHQCLSCVSAACINDATCTAACFDEPAGDTIRYDSAEDCESLAYGGAGCDPIVCVEDTSECKVCSDVATTSNIFEGPTAGCGPDDGTSMTNYTTVAECDSAPNPCSPPSLPPPSPPPPPPPPPAGYACHEFNCISCASEVCMSDTVCAALCMDPYTSETDCDHTSNGGKGCDPVVCVETTEQCAHCSALANETSDSCIIYDVLGAGYDGTCGCPSDGNEFTSWANLHSCEGADSPCLPPPPSPPPKIPVGEKPGGCDEGDEGDDCDDDDDGDEAAAGSPAEAVVAAAKAAEVAVHSAEMLAEQVATMERTASQASAKAAAAKTPAELAAANAAAEQANTALMEARRRATAAALAAEEASAYALEVAERAYTGTSSSSATQSLSANHTMTMVSVVFVAGIIGLAVIAAVVRNSARAREPMSAADGADDDDAGVSARGGKLSQSDRSPSVVHAEP